MADEKYAAVLGIKFSVPIVLEDQVIKMDLLVVEDVPVNFLIGNKTMQKPKERLYIGKRICRSNLKGKRLI